MVSTEMPTSMPTIRATTTRALAIPWVSSAVVDRIAALTGASASPNPSPPSDQRHVGREAVEAGRVPLRHPEEADGREQHADRGDHAGGQPADQVATDDGADRQRDEEPQQHQRRAELGLADSVVVRAKSGMSTSAAISAQPTRKLTRSEPHAGTAASAARGMIGASARTQVHDERGRREAGAEQEPAALRVEHRDLGVGAREREHDAAERDRQQGRADQVGVLRRAEPAADVDERAAGERRSGAARTTAAPTAIAPTGVTQRLPPSTYGMKSWPQVRSRFSSAGWRKTRKPAARSTTAASPPSRSGLPRLRSMARAAGRPRSRPSAASPPAHGPRPRAAPRPRG